MRSLFGRLTGIAALAAGLAAGPVQAGPWAREKGELFLILSQEASAGGEGWTGLWAEYGLTPRLTLGLDAGRSRRGEGKLVLWGQKAWVRGEHRFAASLGLGASFSDAQVMPLGQGGLAWGRGISTPLGPGWLAVEGRAIVTAKMAEFTQTSGRTRVTYAYAMPETSAKAELTLGLRPRERLMAISQIQLEMRPDEGTAARLAGSLVFDLWQPARLELGLVAPLRGEGEAALKLGLWLAF